MQLQQAKIQKLRNDVAISLKAQEGPSVLASASQEQDTVKNSLIQPHANQLDARGTRPTINFHDADGFAATFGKAAGGAPDRRSCTAKGQNKPKCISNQRKNETSRLSTDLE